MLSNIISTPDASANFNAITWERSNRGSPSSTAGLRAPTLPLNCEPLRDTPMHLASL